MQNNQLETYYRGINPLGEAVMNGYNVVPCGNYRDQAFFYAGTFALTASQTIFNQLISIDTDADYIVNGVVVSTNSVDLQFTDSENYTLSNDFLPASSFSANFGSPFPIFPAILLPAGGKFGLNLRNATVVAVTVTVFLVGFKRIRL